MKIAKPTLALFLFLACAAPSEAGLIDFTVTGVGSGQLGAFDFTDKLITLSTTVSTDDVANLDPGIFAVETTTTVTVADVGSGTFLGDIRVLVNQNLGLAGFTSFSGGAFLFGTLNAAFATYDLTTPIGPLSGGFVGNPGQAFATTAGDFVIDVPTTTTFTATAGVVPEPASLALLGSGLTGAWCWALRRAGKARPGRD